MQINSLKSVKSSFTSAKCLFFHGIGWMMVDHTSIVFRFPDAKTRCQQQLFWKMEQIEASRLHLPSGSSCPFLQIRPIQILASGFRRNFRYSFLPDPIFSAQASSRDTSNLHSVKRDDPIAFLRHPRQNRCNCLFPCNCASGGIFHTPWARIWQTSFKGWRES